MQTTPAMETGNEVLTDEAWFEQVANKFKASRVPINGMLELTSRCNLRCVHCYLGPQEEQHKKRSMEMSTQDVFGVIDELCDAGCLFLTITGGDPMMRKDFPEIYRYAKARGIYVTVFCDGVLVNEKYIELFRELPPYKVEVSIYGATKETYEKVTRIKGSYEKCIRGIDMLVEAGIKLELKTVLMEPNKHELEQMRKMAEDRGVDFRFDGAIFPCLPNSEKEPLGLRVEPEEIVWKEMSNESYRQRAKRSYDKQKEIPKSDRMYVCGAGLTSFYIDPYGNLGPCIMTTNYKYQMNLSRNNTRNHSGNVSGKGSGFKEIWEGDIRKMRELRARAEHECSSCDMRGLCSGCAAFNYLEMGAEDEKSEYVCSITKLRHASIMSPKPLQKPIRLSDLPDNGAGYCNGGDELSAASQPKLVSFRRS